MRGAFHAPAQRGRAVPAGNQIFSGPVQPRGAGMVERAEVGERGIGQMDDVRGEASGLILFVAGTERDGARFPAATMVAAEQRAGGVEVLVVRIRLPLRGLASAGDDDTRAA